MLHILDIRRRVRPLAAAVVCVHGLAGAALAQDRSAPRQSPAPASPSAAAPSSPSATALPPLAPAIVDTPALKAGQPALTVRRGAGWPSTAADLKQPSPAAAPSDWTREEKLVAEAQCAQLLKGIVADLTKTESIKDGECGAASPFEVRSIGASPAVVLSPPAIMSCEMVAALHTWLRRDLQPSARKLIGAPVVKLEVMSSYSCRNAYGRAKTRLSEHGRANALDVRAFVTSSGQSADLLADWGPTRRDIIAAAAAAQREVAQAAAREAAAKAQAARSLASRSAPAAMPASGPTALGAVPGAQPSDPAVLATGGLRSTLGTVAKGIAANGVTIGRNETDEDADSGRLLSFSPPSRLGGPKGKTTVVTPAAPAAPPINGGQLFLRQAHTSACTIFGTVLGPEANNAHRNHFHLDMAERQTGNFCE